MSLIQSATTAIRLATLPVSAVLVADPDLALVIADVVAPVRTHQEVIADETTVMTVVVDIEAQDVIAAIDVTIVTVDVVAATTASTDAMTGAMIDATINGAMVVVTGVL